MGRGGAGEAARGCTGATEGCTGAAAGAAGVVGGGAGAELGAGPGSVAGGAVSGEADVPGLVRPPASGVPGPSGAPDVPVPNGVTAEGAADGAAEGAGSSDQSR